MEQQILVAGTDAILFVVSDGTEENRAQCWYESVPERRKQLIAGWKQFQEDLANYVPEAKAELVEAEPVKDLPALRYTMDGLSLSSNLAQFEQEAKAQIEEASKPLECDQDFANGPDAAKEIKKNFNNSDVCILQNLRHMALVEDYKTVFVKIDEFLVSLNLH